MKSYLTKQLTKVRNKSKIYFSSLALFLTGVSAHIVYAADPFEKVKTLHNKESLKYKVSAFFYLDWDLLLLVLSIA